jgi:hypothetical protein
MEDKKRRLNRGEVFNTEMLEPHKHVIPEKKILEVCQNPRERLSRIVNVVLFDGAFTIKLHIPIWWGRLHVTRDFIRILNAGPLDLASVHIHQINDSG